MLFCEIKWLTKKYELDDVIDEHALKELTTSWPTLSKSMEDCVLGDRLTQLKKDLKKLT